jgi:DNA-binding protein HU-beta
MNKGDIIDAMAAAAGVSKVQANNAINGLLQNVTAALKKGERVTLVGFGTFAVVNRKARAGRNPQNGAPLKIAARRVVKFTAGAELKAAVNRKAAARAV